MERQGTRYSSMRIDDDAIRISLLNGFGVQNRDHQVELPGVGARLVAYLALQGRPVRRCAIAGTLWPDTTQEKAQASLRSTLWRIRRVHNRIVHSVRECVALDDSVDVDTDDVLGTSHALTGQSDLGCMTDAMISRLSSELLPDWHDDWVVFERERFRLLALHALEHMSECFVECSDFRAAIECALAAVRLEPLRESAHRSLIEAHIAQGNASEAVHQFQNYRELLRLELGIEPSVQMSALLTNLGVRQSLLV